MLNVPSPCVGVCQVDAGEICIGCGRSLSEIANWTMMSDVEKIAVAEAARLRRQATEQAE
jgi:uncharacterized protein